ncbi:MAG: RNA pseudouridine synthase [Deltaproteobacteria bacterium]|nr:RNA pseudouridine synthase [Deltaproteobacteria bacterium]
MSGGERRLVLKQRVGGDDPRIAIDFLSARCSLSRSALKDAMNKGAVWLTPRRGKRRRLRQRLRRATALLAPGDTIELCYDPRLLAAIAPRATLVEDRGRYSVWFKPAGLLAQGTDFGDHCALLRQVERHFDPRRQVFLVHRLDREACGLTLVAHDAEMTAALSALFREDRVRKRYRALVRGDLAAVRGGSGRIDLPIDGKPALTEFAVVGFDRDTDTSEVDVVIHSGRLHQIRRHLDAVGCPVVGDPRYGRGNKNREGLRLAAVALEFVCPIREQPASYAVAAEALGW